MAFRERGYPDCACCGTPRRAFPTERSKARKLFLADRRRRPKKGPAEPPTEEPGETDAILADDRGRLDAAGALRRFMRSWQSAAVVLAIVSTMVAAITAGQKLLFGGGDRGWRRSWWCGLFPCRWRRVGVELFSRRLRVDLFAFTVCLSGSIFAGALSATWSAGWSAWCLSSRKSWPSSSGPRAARRGRRSAEADRRCSGREGPQKRESSAVGARHISPAPCRPTVRRRPRRRQTEGPRRQTGLGCAGISRRAGAPRCSAWGS